MAICYPKIEDINRIFPSTTPGELHLLNFLYENLSDDYEIYFQPYLNGDCPDIIVLRKNVGVLIIEVKDWELNYYDILDKNTWMVRSNGARISSPFKQVADYKDNIYNLHVDNLVQMKIHNPSLFSIVSCAVYFHKASRSEIQSAIIGNLINQGKDVVWSNYIDIMTPDELNLNNLKNLLNRRHLDRVNTDFSDSIYFSLKRIIQPDNHTLEKGLEIIYSKEQLILTLSKPGPQKIKGVAGGGKSMVLSKRAVNAHIRTGKQVLIVTYNISLRNYIHDRISEVREKFSWAAFNIIHFHQLINSTRINNNIYTVDEINSDESDKTLNDTTQFDSVKENLPKYDSIFIDEGQDYQKDWFVIITKYFLKEGGEIVIFADEKQNIYKNELDEEKKIKTNLFVPWNNSLKKSYRLSSDIATMASEFQKHFWPIKYENDKIEPNIDQRELFSKQIIQYKYLTILIHFFQH